ncbi:lysine N(6)-hydroxylase/L-ornithine N(5)-oxygenase family protein [Thalassiella azotivora]
MTTTHDLLGIGLGPFNLGLAALADPVPDLDAVFLESRDELSWHPGMLLDGVTLQVPFLADLVTMADPTHPLSFLAYLKDVGRLYPFYIRESFYPLRSEYDAYCRWAAERMGSLRFGHHVTSVEHDAVDDVYVVRAGTAGGEVTHRARHVVVGTGTVPYLPSALAGVDGVVHTADYLPSKAALTAHRDVTVVGGGQSAAEVFLDLLRATDSLPAGERRLTWLTRSPRFFPLEYTKLTLEMTSPDYVDYFHALPAPTRDRLVGSQRGLYKGINGSLVDEIFDTLYERRARGRDDVRLVTAAAVTAAERGADGRLTLTVHHTEQDAAFRFDTDAVVAGTGYAHRVPDCLAPLDGHLRRDAQGRLDVRRDYSVDLTGGRVFVQNAELHTHGFVTPDLGMGAYRSSCILRSVTGREVYRVEERVAVQDFGVPPWGERVPGPGSEGPDEDADAPAAAEGVRA